MYESLDLTRWYVFASQRKVDSQGSGYKSVNSHNLRASEYDLICRRPWPSSLLEQEHRLGTGKAGEPSAPRMLPLVCQEVSPTRLGQKTTSSICSSGSLSRICGSGREPHPARCVYPAVLSHREDVRHPEARLRPLPAAT